MGSRAVRALLTSERASETSSSRRDRDVLGATRVGADDELVLAPGHSAAPPSGSIETRVPRRLRAARSEGWGTTNIAARRVTIDDVVFDAAFFLVSRVELTSLRRARPAR